MSYLRSSAVLSVFILSSLISFSCYAELRCVDVFAISEPPVAKFNLESPFPGRAKILLPHLNFNYQIPILNGEAKIVGKTSLYWLVDVDGTPFYALPPNKANEFNSSAYIYHNIIAAGLVEAKIAYTTDKNILYLLDYFESLPKNKSSNAIHSEDTISSISKTALIKQLEQIDKISKLKDFDFSIDFQHDESNIKPIFSFKSMDQFVDSLMGFGMRDNQVQIVGLKLQRPNIFEQISDSNLHLLAKEDPAYGLFTIADWTKTWLLSKSKGDIISEYFEGLIDNSQFKILFEHIFRLNYILENLKRENDPRGNIIEKVLTDAGVVFNNLPDYHLRNWGWISRENLDIHYRKHGIKDFNLRSRDEYEDASLEFLNYSHESPFSIRIFRDSSDRAIIYDVKTKELIVAISNDAFNYQIITYYKLSNQYYYNQKDSNYLGKTIFKPDQ